MTESQKKRGRPVTHDEAEAAAHRLIHSHFRTPNQARCSIPSDPMDDDLVICDYIREQRAKTQAAPVARRPDFYAWRLVIWPTQEAR